MNSKQWIDKADKYIIKTYGRYPLVPVKGKGCYLWDADGKRYLDFLAGVAVNNLGHCHPRVVAALQKQAGELIHCSNFYHIPQQIELAELLCTHSFADRAFFCNSGAEANEAAIKLARKYSREKFGTERFEIITAISSFHGRTMATVSATGQEKVQRFFDPLLHGFKHVPFNDAEALRSAVSPVTCAVMLEPVQGEGGVVIPSAEYFREVRRICDENNLILIFDEVQTGIGRTGSLFCFQQYGITPDAVTFAKGVAAGLPFGGVLAAKSCAATLSAGTHATTFGGNPICAAGANAVLAELTPDFLGEVTQKGAYIRETVAGWNLPVVTSVRGLGLMIGIGVSCSHREAVGKLVESGLLALTAGADTIRLMPPLTITKDEIDAGLAILKAILSAY